LKICQNRPMKQHINAPPDPLNSPRIHVTDEPVLGLPVTEIAERLQSGAGKPVQDSKTELPAQAGSFVLDESGAQAAAGLRTYLADPVGEGYWDILEVSQGMFLVVADACYHQTQHIQMTQERLLKIRAICAGAISIPGRNEPECEGSAHAQFVGGGSAAHYQIATGSRLQMVGLHVQPEALKNLGVSDQRLPASIRRLLTNPDQHIPFLSIEPVGRVIRLAREILGSRDNLPMELRVTYLRAKALELFCEVMQRVMPDDLASDDGEAISRRDSARIREAERIIASHLDTRMTTEALARLIGINRTKLNSGFKAMFGSSLYSYLTRLRMEEALRLLESSDLPIAEIGSRVGYPHPPHFSKVVKSRFGLTPRQLRDRASTRRTS